MKSHTVVFLIFLVALWPTSQAAAQAPATEKASAAAAVQLAPPDANQPTVVELLVAPAPEPQPALRYSLLPTPAERTPGNAVQLYYRAILMQKLRPKEYWQEYGDKSKLWLAAGSDDAAAKVEMGQWLAEQRNAIAEIRLAAFRERCDWEIRFQDLRGLDTINILLPEIQECRNLARTLQLQARYQMLDGRPSDAFQTLRVGYQLARDTAQPQNLICGLVGIAISNMMNEELLHLIQATDTNYYWALVALPDPLVDLRPALETELNLPFQLFPFLADAETADRTQAEWRRLIVDCVGNLGNLEGGGKALEGWQAELAATALLAKLYPVAKERLVAGGMDAAKVEAMPVGQVVAIHTARSIRYAYHELFKTFLLPQDEAARRLPTVTSRLISEGYLGGGEALSGQGGLPVAGILLPGYENILTASLRVPRNLAALQTIEAIRMQAAADGGKLPASLAAVTIVPASDNPATGQPFAYSLDAATGTATLDVPPLGKLTPQQDGKRYVIRLKAK